MTPVSLGGPLNDTPEALQEWIVVALRMIEEASYEDISEVADGYSITGSLTETRVLNVTTPTATNIANVLATFLRDVHRRGQKRTS